MRHLRYPVFIISKGRWESRNTVKKLLLMSIPFKICVEPAEYSEYKAVIDKKSIIKLPENFSEQGNGSIPVRNWVWEHAIKLNVDRYWLLDDNIMDFRRINRNKSVQVHCNGMFIAMEDFTDRYKNIAFSGPQDCAFVRADICNTPFIINSRVYSCTLIKTDLPYRWRGRYNEDTDLILRALKDKWNTILFYAFNINKGPTMKMKGGNTDTVYNTGDNRRAFAKSLKEQHPSLVKIVRKYGRWHHFVDYTLFKHNKLVFRDDYIKEEGVNNYGMVLDYIKRNKIENVG